MEFEWDPEKAIKNQQKHGISFYEATTVFGDLLAITVYDPDHSIDEERYIMVGLSDRQKLLIVSYAERANKIRIISARELTNLERESYETGNFT